MSLSEDLAREAEIQRLAASSCLKPPFLVCSFLPRSLGLAVAGGLAGGLAGLECGVLGMGSDPWLSSRVKTPRPAFLPQQSSTVAPPKVVFVGSTAKLDTSRFRQTAGPLGLFLLRCKWTMRVPFCRVPKPSEHGTF